MSWCGGEKSLSKLNEPDFNKKNIWASFMLKPFTKAQRMEHMLTCCYVNGIKTHNLLSRWEKHF